jgi:predicted kinase
VILDATYKHPEDRRTVLGLSARCQVPLVFVECHASAATVERRLREREQRGDNVSDATWVLAQRERASFPPFTDLPAQSHVVIDTEGDADAELERVEEGVRIRHAGRV